MWRVLRAFSAQKLLAVVAGFAVSVPHFWAFAQSSLERSHSPNAELQGPDLQRPKTQVELTLSRTQLPNGLRVVLNPALVGTTVAVAVTYGVGSKDDALGQGGFAHLFQHMMFQGSRNVEKGDHLRLIAARGGYASGSTSKDSTSFVQALPASDLELALWLEADRMKGLAINRENFENQRLVVQEKVRANDSGKADTLGYVRLMQLVFQGYWPYEHPTTGFLQDLDAAEYARAGGFHQTYYAPNNAVLSISGNFDPARATELVAKHFGGLRPNARPPEFRYPVQFPRQTSERLSVVEDVQARTPTVYYGYRISPPNSRAHRALKLASLVLAAGDSSRLYQSLVIEKAAVSSVSSWTAGYQGADAWVIQLVISPLSSVDTAQTWLDGEMKRLRLIGPSEAELSKAKQILRVQWLKELETAQGRAVQLGTFETAFGDAALLNQELRAFDDITSAEIREAASQFLQDTRRSIVEVYPPGWVRDLGPVEVTKTHVVKSGENLIRIAAHYGTSAEALAKQNGISIKKAIVPGQRLLVTLGATAKAAQRTHKVKPGESLIGIAKRYQISVSALAAANNLSTKKPIRPGQELVVPRAVPTQGAAGKDKLPESKGAKPAEPRSARKPDEPKATVRTYTVKRGDTVIGIAKRYGVTVAALAKENDLGAGKRIYPGQTLKITVTEAPKIKAPSGRGANQ